MSRLILAFMLLLVVSGNALAQTSARVRVVKEAIVWQTGFLSIAAVLKVDTELDVISRQGDWLEVRLPVSTQGTTEARTGFIALSQVQVISGPGQEGLPETRPTPPPPLAVSSASTASWSGYRGFGQFGYGRFAADQSFNAVLQSRHGVWFGAGGEFRTPQGFFIGAAVDRFQRDGERVFVSDDGEVFRLGIKDVVTLTPVTVTGGYHFTRSAVSPYVGGGIGRYFFSETSPIATDAEIVKLRFTSYHLVAGIEWVGTQHFGTAFEMQYTKVPDSLTGAVSSAFGEHELGGIQTRVRLIFR